MVLLEKHSYPSLYTLALGYDSEKTGSVGAFLMLRCSEGLHVG